MRKLALIALAVATVTVLSGCAMVMTPVPGLAYTEVNAPMCRVQAPIDLGAGSTKIGMAKCESILGLVATGDASVQAAMKNGQITKVHHVDYKARCILGVYAEYTVLVYGE